MALDPCFVGLDVAKDHIDVSIRPSGEGWQAAQTEDGLTDLVTRVAALTPTLVVLEATAIMKRRWRARSRSRTCRSRW